MGLRGLTSGVSALGAQQAVDPFAQVQTVFSGADPAIADMAGTSAIQQGTYPQSSNQAIAQSWLTASPWTTSTPSATSATSGTAATTQAPPTASTLTSVVFFVIAIILLLAGAFAIVGPGNVESAATMAA
jgi:hypothetical protein